MTKTHTAKDILTAFVEDLNQIYNNQNFGLSLLILSLYSEYIINELIKKSFGYGLDDDKDVTHSMKLKFLRGPILLLKANILL